MNYMISSKISICPRPMSLAWVVFLACVTCLRALYVPTQGIDERGASKPIKEVKSIMGYTIGDRQFEATSDTMLKKKERPQWKITSSNAICEVNSEGIKPAAWRSDVDSDVSCQDHCLKRANCIAVDYIPGHKLCVFYKEACTTPQKKAKKSEGGISFHLDRGASWVDIGKACHPPAGPSEGAKEDRDHEGIRKLSRKGFMKDTLEECQDSCRRSANCMSIDYFPDSKICNWYDGVCSSPSSGGTSELASNTSERGSSWRLQLERGQSGLTMAEMKRFGEWVAISTDKACARSGDGIEADFMIRTQSLKECQTACQHRSQCVAVDYYSATGNCNQYTEACQTPRDTKDGASSYRIERKWFQWKAIDRSRACEENNEGIGFVAHRLNVPEMTICKDMCTRKADCVAFDFFRDLASCSLYNEACTGPLADRHGASSYELVRKDVVVEEPKTQDSGFSVQKGMKMRLY